MKLKELIKNLNYSELKNYDGEIKVTSLHNKSENVAKNSLYFCITGTQVDGHDFAEKSVENGAIVLVVERFLKNITNKVAQIVVSNSRQAMAEIAKSFYNNASDDLIIVGVVGTNGKTSTSLLLHQILIKQGIRAAIIGTDGIVAKGYFHDTSMTTPDPIELHKILFEMKQLAIEVVVLEVSAQAIYFKKIYGINFYSAALTNISKEHLDFFKDYSTYANTKLSFFNDYNIKNKIFNNDCKEGMIMSENFKIINEKKVKKQMKMPFYLVKRKQKKDKPNVVRHKNKDISNIITYGIANPSDIFALDIKMSIKGCEFIVNAKNNILYINSKLVGLFNVYNILAAISLAKTLKCKDKVILSELNGYKDLKGRYNIFHLDCNNKVIVDFSHTEKAFEEVFKITKKLRNSGRIIAVFGCVGYSDYNKRKNIGKLAGIYCDEVILTSDNPNYTSINTINSDIKDGLNKYNNVIISEQTDRDLAIMKGVEKLVANDTLLILGKGDEKFNKIMGENISQNDFESVNKAIEKCYNFKRTVAKSIE